MLVHNVKQGEPEWFRARLGIPTASEFSNLITPTGALAGDAARSYARRLVCEILTDSPRITPQTQWMERGNELEQEAVRAYEFTTDLETEAIGFITDDDYTMGCSPDRLVGEDGLLEIKCPASWTHIEYMLDRKIDKQYKPQIQAQMLITGRKWVDWYSFHPELPQVIIRMDRDEEYIQRMRNAAKRFSSIMNMYLEDLTQVYKLTAHQITPTRILPKEPQSLIMAG